MKGDYMKKAKNSIAVWILILTMLLQNTVCAEMEQEVINTAPEANFTIEKNRNVKILVLTDYTGTDNANLKNALSSMKSELANHAKINIEYANPEIVNIGKQDGKVQMNYWGKNGYASYTWSGYRASQQYGEPVLTEYRNKQENEKFIYSNTITLPEGQEPLTFYGVPIRYVKSDLKKSESNQAVYSYREYYTYTFINANGICDGPFNLTIRSENRAPNGMWNESYISSYTEPVFTFDSHWSIQGSYEESTINDVIGWDLSGLNYELPDVNTDTFVIFALNRGNTNYYKAYTSSSYLLGQLRNDSTIGKYIKDTDARVYSICSDEIENINLSTNAKYPITFGTNIKAQNISIKDLIESSFDGRSVGEKNITGLTNKIKENVRRPNGNIDMIVASDNSKDSINYFVDNVKNSVSDDVSVSATIIDGDSFETVDTWKKYVTRNNFKTVSNTFYTDATLVLTENGELWGIGSNYIGEVRTGYNSTTKVYGLFGLSSTVERYNRFVKIAEDVKNVYLKNFNGLNTIFIIKNDGRLWACGGGFGVIYIEDPKNGGFEKQICFRDFTYMGYSDVKSLAFGLIDTWDMHVVSGNGVYRMVMNSEWFYDTPRRDPLAPANTKYVFNFGGSYSSSTNLYYIGEDGKVTYSNWRYTEQGKELHNYTELPPNPVETDALGVFKCDDGKYYNLNGECLSKGINFKQIYDKNGLFGVTYDGKLYVLQQYSWTTYSFSDVDKILFVQENNSYSPGIIYRTIDGNMKFLNRISPENTFRLEDLKCYDWESTGYEGYWPTIFDASIGGLAADYLQLGNRFCYVTKDGNICYVQSEYKGKDSYGMKITTFKTVNCGSLDTIFDISDKPVKAISKSKIFNTPLREESERYFIYISDNVQPDTYFSDHTEYFPFSHLDNSVLNYLNANRFNIYIVTPQQARNLKLTYPNVPVNRQQLSLYELIYNSVMDSAFCTNTDIVIKLIAKRYDTYTKHGSTTLTILVNEESVRYNQVYRDFENDPKYSERWLYTHDPTYFDNSNGLDPNSGQWISTPVFTFSKVGKYIVNAQFRDNPKDDDMFDNYRLWSNKSAPATILVHRRPIAKFSTQISEIKGANVYLSYLDQSYDLDHNKSRTDKGIVARYWQYKKSISDTWSEGKPLSLPYNSGIYQVKLMVKDMEGVWSKPYIEEIDTSNLPPTITATPLTYTGEGPINITIKASDNGEDDFAYMRYAITDTNELPGSSQWIKVEDGKKERTITISSDGTYYLHMEAYDKLGQVGKNLTGPYIINNLKAGNFFITMMLDVGWRSYYFDLNRGIDDNHDGITDRYPRRPNTDIGTLKMPINYYNLVSSPRTYIKAGYKVKGRIDIKGNPDSAKFNINYMVKEVTHTDSVNLVKGTGDTYTFEWIIPLETDDKSFINFDLVMKKGGITYGNEKWNDVWDSRNSSRYVFYVCGKATDDLIFVQSQ